MSSAPRTPPLAGGKPQRYISLGTLGYRCSGDGGWSRRPAPEFIPDRSPGHAFLPIYRGGIIEHIELFQILRVRTGTRSRSRQIRYQVTTTSVC